MFRGDKRGDRKETCEQKEASVPQQKEDNSRRERKEERRRNKKIGGEEKKQRGGREGLGYLALGEGQEEIIDSSSIYKGFCYYKGNDDIS